MKKKAGRVRSRRPTDVELPAQEDNVQKKKKKRIQDPLPKKRDQTSCRKMLGEAHSYRCQKATNQPESTLF